MGRQNIVKAMQMGRQKMTERCLAVAKLLIRDADVRVVDYLDRTCRGWAWPAEKRIRVPRPTTRRRLYTLAHECGHVALGHTGKKKVHRQEYEAEQYAHKAFRQHGIAVPRASTTRAKQYVVRKIRMAINRGAQSIDLEALRWCQDYLPEPVKQLLRQEGLN